MMSSATSLANELEFALDLVKRAGEIAVSHFRKGVVAEMKADDSPVTIADRECERMIREELQKRHPGDDLLGEEEGETTRSGTSKRKWIIDPIDGTYNYARGIPIYSTLLALEEDGDIVLGIVHAPSMNETFWAAKGQGAFRNGERLHVSEVSDISRAQFVFGAPSRIMDDGYWDALKRIVVATYRQRAFGDYLNFAHVFEGKAEAVLEVGVKPWDLAPMKIITEEAGGKYADLAGGSSIYTGSCLATNALLHQEFLRLFNPN